MHLPKLEADAFFDLIAFTGRNSVGIVEIFTALLRLLLKDKVSVYRIIQSVPKHLSIEHRANLFTDSDSTPSNKQSLFLDLSGYSTLCSPEVENKVVEDLLSWCHNDIHDSSFDSSYNGLAVLPRALSSDTITPTTWSAILRAIILRLEPVKQMRRQVTMRSSDIASKLKPLVKSSSASSVISAGTVIIAIIAINLIFND